MYSFAPIGGTYSHASNQPKIIDAAREVFPHTRVVVRPVGSSSLYAIYNGDTGSKIAYAQPSAALYGPTMRSARAEEED